MINDSALGVDAALARVHAEGVVAGLVKRTLLVSLAANLDRLSCLYKKMV